MILSDATIKQLLASGEIVVQPSVAEQDIRPAGVRLHLGEEVLIPEDGQTVDPTKLTELKYAKQQLKDGFVLKPGMFLLASTREKIQVSRSIVGKLDGRSTVARLGMLIHVSSDTIDGNHDEPRAIVLEIKNLGNFNIVLKAGMPVGMIVFSKLSQPIAQKSQSQYRNQTGVAPPNLEGQLK